MSTWDILGVRLYDQETRAISIVWDKNCSVITVTGRGWGASRKTMLSSRGNGGSWRGGRLIASAVWESLTTKLLLLAGWVSQMDAWANPTTKLELVCTLCLWHSFLHCTLNYSGISKPFFITYFLIWTQSHKFEYVWLCPSTRIKIRCLMTYNTIVRQF